MRAVLRALRPPPDPPVGDRPEPLTTETHRATASVVIGPAAVEWAVWAADRLCHFVLDNIRQVGGGPGPIRMLRQSAESRILDILVHLAEGTEPAHATEYAVAVAADFARRGVELQHALGGITLGHQFLSRTLLELVDRESPAAQRSGAYRTISDLLFRYHNIQLADVAEAYKAERVRWAASTAAARRATVISLLDESEADLSGVGQLLNYDVTGHHLALLAWTADSHLGKVRPEQVHRFVGRLARRVGCTNPLIVPEDDTTLWAWIGRATAFSDDDLAHIRTSPDPEEGVLVALGDRARGLTGFRASHRTAAQTRRVVTLAATGGWLADYDTLGLVSLLTGDPDSASWFIARELGELAAADHKTADIRETVRVYLGTGGSLVAAARRLQVARNTIVYRLKRAEELRGRPVRDRVAELHAALELLHVLGNPDQLSRP